MNFVVRHLGFICLIPILIILAYLGTHDFSLLPDPLETLFDWAGMVVSMGWIASAHILLGFGAALPVVALLDRCPHWHTVSLICGVAIASCLIYLGGYLPFRLGVGTFVAIASSGIYLGFRLILERTIPFIQRARARG